MPAACIFVVSTCCNHRKQPEEEADRSGARVLGGRWIRRDVVAGGSLDAKRVPRSLGRPERHSPVIDRCWVQCHPTLHVTLPAAAWSPATSFAREAGGALRAVGVDTASMRGGEGGFLARRSRATQPPSTRRPPGGRPYSVQGPGPSCKPAPLFLASAVHFEVAVWIRTGTEQAACAAVAAKDRWGGEGSRTGQAPGQRSSQIQ